VTKHWRNFIRPLMLRLKWIELKLRQLKSQERKYSRELFQEYQWAKHKTPKHFSLEESGSKSIPFSSHQYRSKTKMRRKRKRVEETSDIAAYTSNHFIFSYLGTYILFCIHSFILIPNFHISFLLFTNHFSLCLL
jgi:hypothetical protein